MRNAHRLMANGVTIFRPETTVIDADVMVGADTVIEPYVQLLGATRIGKIAAFDPIRCWRMRSWAIRF